MCTASPTLASPRITVGDVFRSRYASMGMPAGMSKEQRKAWFDIIQCRTPVLGGHLHRCQSCGYEHSRFNSCGNRNCPSCQSLAQARWIEARLERVLPVGHFHVVFTLPACLREIACRNQRIVYDSMFHCARETLLQLCADPKHLGALPGVTSVLHTWTRQLDYHPHLHCIVTAGGLRKDDGQWVSSRLKDKFLLPVRVVSRLFRGKLMADLHKAEARGLLDWGNGPKDPEAFDSLRRKSFEKDWVVYAKRPFGSDHAVFRYLGRYTHRVGISNQRLLSHEDGNVTFLTKNGKHLTLPEPEFVRRFLLHVLPKGFVKIRHSGLYASPSVPSLLLLARQALAPTAPAIDSGATQPSSVQHDEHWTQTVARLSATHPLVCPRCASPLSVLPIGASRWNNARAPPRAPGAAA